MFNTATEARAHYDATMRGDIEKSALRITLEKCRDGVPLNDDERSALCAVLAQFDPQYGTIVDNVETACFG